MGKTLETPATVTCPLSQLGSGEEHTAELRQAQNRAGNPYVSCDECKMKAFLNATDAWEQAEDTFSVEAAESPAEPPEAPEVSQPDDGDGDAEREPERSLNDLLSGGADDE